MWKWTGSLPWQPEISTLLCSSRRLIALAFSQSDLPSRTLSLPLPRCPSASRLIFVEGLRQALLREPAWHVLPTLGLPTALNSATGMLTWRAGQIELGGCPGKGRGFGGLTKFGGLPENRTYSALIPYHFWRRKRRRGTELWLI